MRLSGISYWLVALFCCVGCSWPQTKETVPKDSVVLVSNDTAFAKEPQKETSPVTDSALLKGKPLISMGNTKPEEVVNFAKTLMGTPYVYASSDPKVGFDCSGFITYVFNHFGIVVPRSSVDFTNVGIDVPESGARQGDLILFTGTNPSEGSVGHMGLVINNRPDSVQFIHSSSGKAMGVTVTPLNQYYRTRFVKIIRIFP